MKKTLLPTVFKLIILSLAIGFLYSCENKTEELNKFLTQKEIQYEQICFDLGQAYWNFYSDENEYDLKAPKDDFYALLTNDTLNNLIDTWHLKKEEINDTILKRRIDMWHNVLLSAKVEYDADIMKLRNELEEMFDVSGEADKSNYDYEGNIVKLIKMRNQKSVELGFDNYAHLSFEVNGLGYEWFTNFVKVLDEATVGPYTDLVNELKKEQNINDFSRKQFFYFIGQFFSNNNPRKINTDNNIELVKESLHNIGINYDELPAKLVEMELPDGIGGQGLMINIPNDFRAVMTLGMDISVWMHEMGHGLHGLYNSINTPILEGYEWIPGNGNGAFAEGMAETNARFAQNIEWQIKYTELTEDEIIKRKELVNKYAPVFIRYHLFYCLRELNLYLNPEKPFEEIDLELAKKYFLIETNDLHLRGLKDMIYVSYPLYLQNYLLADLVSTQIHTTLEEKFGKDYAFNKDVGKYLADKFYSKGEYFDWNTRLENGTGKPLDIEQYLKFYNIK